MKKRLLMIVGAGASIDFGLPSVSALDKILDCYGAKLYPLASDPSANLYGFARDEIQKYYGGSPKPMLQSWTNFEEVIYQLNLMAPYLADPNHSKGSNALLRPISLPEVLEYGRDRKTVDAQVLRALSSNLLDTIVDHFIDACAGLGSSKKAEIAELSKLLDTLRREFDLGIITLNYDDIFERACPDLFTGFDPSTGKFNALSVFNRTDWDFIYHLHGSIHFAMTGPSFDLHGITWADAPTKDHTVHAFGRSSQSSTEGTDYPTSPIIAGYGKTQQTLRQPFRTYFAQLSRAVLEADSILFVGYGFGDLHLNAAFSEVRDRRRPTLVVDWATDDQNPLPFRHDQWTYNLFKTLPANASDMSEPGHISPSDIADLKARNQVECSRCPDYPLAVYYNGLLGACRNLGTLLSHLR